MKIPILVVLLFIRMYFLNTGCNSVKDKSYTVRFNYKVITINGIPEKEEWISANSIKGLYTPCGKTGYDKTVFKSFHSGKFLYFCFDVHDPIIITHDFQNELTVANEDRVELFFSATSDMSQYYCIELDPPGRILDYSAHYYGEFDDEWDFNNVIIATNYTEQAFHTTSKANGN